MLSAIEYIITVILVIQAIIMIEIVYLGHEILSIKEMLNDEKKRSRRRDL